MSIPFLVGPLAKAVSAIPGGQPVAAGASALSTIIPILTSGIKEIHAGIQRRKERLYNSPAEQVKRFREAGLPLASGSQISGGNVQAATISPDNYGTNQLNDNLSKSITRQIDRKKLEIYQAELRSAIAKAALDEGNARNQLNPTGQFEATNQGLGAQQTLGTQSEILKSASIVNQFMPSEKYQALMKQTKEIDLLTQNIKNSEIANQIQIQDLSIKKILAKYQERMSIQELKSLIKQNAIKDLQKSGMGIDNAAKQLALTFEYRIFEDKVKMAKNAALASDNNLEAQRLNLLLTNLSLPSTEAYYKIRRGMDEGTLAKPNLPNTLLYLGMFQPTTSNYNFGQLMPSIPSGGNTYNTNHNIYPK